MSSAQSRSNGRKPRFVIFFFFFTRVYGFFKLGFLQSIIQRQPEMLQALDAKTRLAVGAREEENKHLKSQVCFSLSLFLSSNTQFSQVAHFKAAAEQAGAASAQQRDILKLLEALTNTSVREADNGRFLCSAKTLDLEPCMEFYLRVDEGGAVEYEPVTVPASAPSFLASAIEFQHGQAVIFFREVLKMLTQKK